MVSVEDGERTKYRPHTMQHGRLGPSPIFLEKSCFLVRSNQILPSSTASVSWENLPCLLPAKTTERE